jgi:hypothetical protein
MDSQSLRWDVATLKEAGGAIGLTVMLDGTPTAAWTTTFRRIAEKRGRKAQHDQWDQVKAESNWVTVSSIEPGSELLLRDYLDGIVSATNQKRELEQQAEEKADQDQQLRSRAVANQAKEMQERIRSPRIDR